MRFSLALLTSLAAICTAIPINDVNLAERGVVTVIAEETAYVYVDATPSAAPAAPEEKPRVVYKYVFVTVDQNGNVVKIEDDIPVEVSSSDDEECPLEKAAKEQAAKEKAANGEDTKVASEPTTDDAECPLEKAAKEKAAKEQAAKEAEKSSTSIPPTPTAIPQPFSNVNSTGSENSSVSEIPVSSSISITSVIPTTFLSTARPTTNAAKPSNAAPVKPAPAAAKPAPAKPAAANSASSLDEWSKIVLDTHNEKRAAHGVEAFAWNATLANFAADYLKQAQCKFEHSKGPYGENLAIGYRTAESPINAWYDEIKDYDFAKAAFTKGTGHFTQMVWKGSNQLGCAKMDCGGSGPYVVCEYWPRGNVIGRFDQHVFPRIN